MKLGNARVWLLAGGRETSKAILVTGGSQETDLAPVRFPDWKKALGKEVFPVTHRDFFGEAIVGTLRSRGGLRREQLPHLEN